MGIQILPAVTSSTVNGSAYVITTANKQYELTESFKAGVYSISVSPTSSTAIISFYNESGTVIATTVSGIISVNLASDVTETYVQSSVDSDLVTISQVANSISGTEISGTLDTITSNGTYTQTGKLYVVCVGGGSGGQGGGGAGYQNGGDGGNAGAIVGKILFTNSSTSVTIGAGGAGGAGSTGVDAINGTAGGTTTFGSLVSAGVKSFTKGGGASTAGIISPNIYTSVKSGTTGGGGGGGAVGNFPGNGAGSGIGTGGNGASSNTGLAGANGTGHGGGGGGGGGSTGTSGAGGNGSAGVIYVLRGF